MKMFQLLFYARLNEKVLNEWRRVFDEIWYLVYWPMHFGVCLQSRRKSTAVNSGSVHRIIHKSEKREHISVSVFVQCFKSSFFYVKKCNGRRKSIMTYDVHQLHFTEENEI